MFWTNEIITIISLEDDNMSTDIDWERLLFADEGFDRPSRSNASGETAEACYRQADPSTSLLPPITPLPDVRPYDFSNKLSSREGWKVSSFLAERCVAIGKDNVKVKVDGIWKTQPRKQAIPTLFQSYGLTQTHHDVDLNAIQTFLRESIQHIDGEAIFPGSGEFVLFENQVFLNTWKDLRIPPVTANIHKAETILRIIRENLCDMPQAPLVEMIEEINGDQPTLFRWVMHWLAAVYQRPGYHIGTALWFVGKRGGVGKGTLLQVLSRLLGECYVGKLDADEMGRGWTTFAGKLLMEGDEFDIGSRKDLTDKFKLWIDNKKISHKARYYGQSILPNTTNFIMTTNNENPLYLDRYDRRHTLTKTTDNPDAQQLARSYHPTKEDQKNLSAFLEHQTEALHGFAGLLSVIDIDYAAIREPFMTDFKSELMRASMDAVECWFIDYDAQWRVGVPYTTNDAFHHFRQWAEKNDAIALKTIPNNKSFGRRLGWLISEGYIERKETRVGSQLTKRKYFDPDTETRVRTEDMIRLRAEVIWDNKPTHSWLDQFMADDPAYVN
jgi:hypothetical protein